MERKRRFILALTGSAGAVLILHLVFAFQWPAWGWGVHALAFYPAWLRVGVTLLGLVLILPSVSAAVTSRVRLPFAFSGKRPSVRYGLYGLSAVLALVLFWTFRAQTHLLGDGALWVRELTGPLGRLASEPLTIALVRFLYDIRDGQGEADAETVYRAVSWACGLLFVFATLATARVVGRNGRERAIVALFLLTLGTVEIFFGYVEHYAPVAVATLLYLCLGVYALERGLPLAVPAGVLGVACAFHFVGLALLPSFGVLVFQACRTRGGCGRALLQSAAFPAVFTGLLLATGFLGFQEDISRLDILSRLVPLWGGDAFWRPHTLFSVVHLADVLNAHLLSVPMAGLLCVCLAATLWQWIAWQDACLVFLGASAAGCLGVMGFFNPEIGAFRDWDLFGLSSIPVALLGAYLLTRSVGPEAQRQAAWTVTVVSALHLIPWVGVNADAGRALRRVETVLRDGGRLSAHARGASYDELRGYYERQGNKALALRAARRAVDAHSEHPRYLNNVVRLMRETGRVDRTESVLQEVVKTTPKSASAHLELARFYREQGRLQAASEAARAAVRLDPNSAAARAEMGVVLHDMGRSPEAAAELERAVALDAEDAWAYHMLGMAYGKMGRVGKSIAAFQKASALDTTSAEVWVNLGVASYLGRRLDESEQAFRRALELAPSSTEAKNGLGIVYQQRGEIGAALRWFREAAEGDATHVEAHLNLATAAYAAGRPEESLLACKRVLDLEPANRAALYNLCALYTELGRLDEAAHYVKRYIELFPDSPEARQLRGMTGHK